MDYAEDSSIVVLQQPPTDVALPSGRPWQNLKRTTEFWLRAVGVYTAYKVIQVRGMPGHIFVASVAFLFACLWLSHNAWTMLDGSCKHTWQGTA